MEEGRGILLCRILTIKTGTGINYSKFYVMLEVNNYHDKNYILKYKYK